MKNTITLNIGLQTSEATGKRPLDLAHVRAVLDSHGFASLVTRSAVHSSNTEPTLVLELVSSDDVADVLAAVAALSDALEQDCVALHVIAEGGTSSGHLVGDAAEAWSPFNPAFFLTLDGRTLAEVEASQAYDAAHAECVTAHGKHVANCKDRAAHGAARLAAARAADASVALSAARAQSL